VTGSKNISPLPQLSAALSLRGRRDLVGFTRETPKLSTHCVERGAPEITRFGLLAHLAERAEKPQHQQHNDHEAEAAPNACGYPPP
jgi:hypothetical protein